MGAYDTNIHHVPRWTSHVFRLRLEETYQPLRSYSYYFYFMYLRQMKAINEVVRKLETVANGDRQLEVRKIRQHRSLVHTFESWPHRMAPGTCSPEYMRSGEHVAA